MFRKFKLATLILTSGFALTASAAEDSWWDRLDVTAVQVVKVSEELSRTPTVTSDCSQMHVTDLSLDTILTVGEKVWSLIEAGKPVVNLNMPPAVAALPRGLQCWTDLEGWQPTHTETYEVSYKNGFGMEVVKFQFRLAYTPGGSIGGHGKYLANVSVVPAQVNVLWGYSFDAGVTVADAVNLGTSVDPVAGMQLTVNWTVKTVVKDSVNSYPLFIRAD
jgi:hypothetical protein